MSFVLTFEDECVCLTGAFRCRPCVQAEIGTGTGGNGNGQLNINYKTGDQSDWVLRSPSP